MVSFVGSGWKWKLYFLDNYPSCFLWLQVDMKSFSAGAKLQPAVGVDDHRQIPLNYCCSRRNDPVENQNYYMSTPVPKVSSFAPVSVVHVTVVMVIVRLPQLVQCGSTSCCVITGNVGGWVGIKTTLPDLAYASLLSCELINISWQIQLHPCWAVLLLVKMNVLSWLLSNQRPWM